MLIDTLCYYCCLSLTKHSPPCILHPLQSLKSAGGLGIPNTTPLGSNTALAALNTLHAPLNGAWIPGIAPNNTMPNKNPNQGSSIYIKGLPEDADKLWLYEKFARFGGIHSVRILIDEHSGHCNGIGFVNFTDPEGARSAHETMNGVSMGERLLHVMVQNNSSGGASGGGGRSRQQQVQQMQQHGGGVVMPQGQGGYVGGMGSGMPDYLNVNAW